MRCSSRAVFSLGVVSHCWEPRRVEFPAKCAVRQSARRGGIAPRAVNDSSKFRHRAFVSRACNSPLALAASSRIRRFIREIYARFLEGRLKARKRPILLWSKGKKSPRDLSQERAPLGCPSFIVRVMTHISSGGAN